MIGNRARILHITISVGFSSMSYARNLLLYEVSCNFTINGKSYGDPLYFHTSAGSLSPSNWNKEDNHLFVFPKYGLTRLAPTLAQRVGDSTDRSGGFFSLMIFNDVSKTGDNVINKFIH